MLITTLAQHNPHHWENRSGIVHLMEWKWSDIAVECEQFLGPRGYGGVQVSPVFENVIVTDRPWWERYQPMSYKIITRSGDEAAFLDMTTRCNAVGIRIYVDILLNHMAAYNDPGVGTAGSTANFLIPEFPAVPYGANDFNEDCDIYDWNNIYQVRNCRLVGLTDLNQAVPWVREKLIEKLNHLVEIGVGGFRLDAAKHMWPEDMEYILNNVNNLNVAFGFAPNSRPFVYQEVIDHGGEAISKYEYVHLGLVTEFVYSEEIGRAFRGFNSLKYLKTWGPEWGFTESHLSFVFVDNHDNQRHPSNVLTYKTPREYKMATAFMLAHPHGVPRIMSSFAFDSSDQGPPADVNGNIIGRTINPDGSCGSGWICEHRWRQIANMVGFKNAVKGTGLNDWWDNGDKQIAFCRGNRGFIAFNGQGVNFSVRLQTCLPEGQYCDIISGEIVNGVCTGTVINVEGLQYADIFIAGDAEDGVIAIHAGPESKLN